MRIRLVLAALVLMGLSFPALAAINYCNPAAPLNSLFCVNELCDPAQLGASTLDKDHRNLIACLDDGFAVGRTIWKAMAGGPTASGGSASYTAYGTNVCGSGWTKQYDGVAMTVMVQWANGNTGSGGGGIVCKQGGDFPDFRPYPELVWLTSYVGDSDGPIACAVCTTP